MYKVMCKTHENRICEIEGCTNLGRNMGKNKDGTRKRGNNCQKHYHEYLAKQKNKKVKKTDDKRIIVDEKDFLDNHVADTTPWMHISDIPTKNSTEYFKFIEEYGKPGIYQIVHKNDIDDISDRIIHPETGYIGEAGDVLVRTYPIRSPGGNHGLKIMMRTLPYFEPDNTTTIDDLRIRYFITKEGSPRKTIENNLHDIMLSELGYSFKWRRASDGKDGYSTKSIDYFSRTDVSDMMTTLPIILRIAKESFIQDAAKKASIKFDELLAEMFGGL